MTLDEFCALVAQLTYKPKTKIEAIIIGDSRQLRVSFFVEDTLGAAGRIHISLSRPIPAPELFADQDDALRWVLWCVDRAERHETREWFRLNGLAIFDPHVMGQDIL